MPKKDTGTQSLPVLGLEQQVQYRATRRARCRCTRQQVLDKLTQRLCAGAVPSIDGLKRRTSDRLQ
jgi:hypothetical protein